MQARKKDNKTKSFVRHIKKKKKKRERNAGFVWDIEPLGKDEPSLPRVIYKGSR
jgi:hypothetical protein